MESAAAEMWPFSAWSMYLFPGCAALDAVAQTGVAGTPLRNRVGGWAVCCTPVAPRAEGGMADVGGCSGRVRVVPSDPGVPTGLDRGGGMGVRATPLGGIDGRIDGRIDGGIDGGIEVAVTGPGRRDEAAARMATAWVGATDALTR